MKKIAPYANLVAGVLRTILPVASPAVNLFFGKNDLFNELALKEALDVMKEATKSLLQGDVGISDPALLRQNMLSATERSSILALHAILHELDPNHQRLGLRQIPTYTGDFLWLCDQHYKDAQPKIPKRIG